MGDLVRFPQEKCRWPELSDQHEPSAVIIVLPVIRIERHGEVARVVYPDSPVVTEAGWLRDYDPEAAVWPPTFWF